MADFRGRKNLTPPPRISDDPITSQWFHEVSARSQVFNGKAAPDPKLGHAGDWYANTVAKHIYVKTVTGTPPNTVDVWTLII
jgi:hypothetical protein